MLKKLEKIWQELDHSIAVNKRELVLGIAACTLGGVVLGMFLSPRKNQVFGSYNTGHVVSADADAEPDAGNA